jgi:hypothetical protein
MIRISLSLIAILAISCIGCTINSPLVATPQPAVICNPCGSGQGPPITPEPMGTPVGPPVISTPAPLSSAKVSPSFSAEVPKVTPAEPMPTPLPLPTPGSLRVPDLDAPAPASSRRFALSSIRCLQ